MAISITSRIRNAMVGLAIALCALFTALIFLLVYVIEDQVFINQLKAEQGAFEKIAATDPPASDDWQPANANILRIDNVDDLPSSLPSTMVSRVVASPGIHEYFDDENAMFIASLRLSNDSSAYYLVYDVKHLLVVQNTKRILFFLIGGLTLVISITAVLVARKLTKSTLAPISRLSGALRDNDLDHVVIDLANDFSGDEVGILTHELAQALERVQKSVQREYEFNRGVSHELRSPIQVAQSATELLQHYASESDTQISKPISRLQRSVAEMNEVVEAFLWLASDRLLEPHDMCAGSALLNTVVDLQFSLPDREIITNVQATESLYPLPFNVLSMVLRSLVRNAASHGDLSAIGIQLQDDRIVVSNSVDSLSHYNKGFGIGMSIVQRICDRFGCELITLLENENQYVCSIVFT